MNETILEELPRLLGRSARKIVLDDAEKIGGKKFRKWMEKDLAKCQIHVSSGRMIGGTFFYCKSDQ